MSVSVNCWFCNEDSLVPARSQDSWECPKCDQFNSFTADGDIALPVSASAGRQNVRYNASVRRAAEPAWQLCHRCNLNQGLKARQLADFRPIVEANWEAELEEYRAHLERIYDTCVYCKSVVARALREKDDMVRPGWLAWLRTRKDQKDTSERETKGRAQPVRMGSVKGSVGTVFNGALMLAHITGLVLLLLLLVNRSMLALTESVVPAEYVLVLRSVDTLLTEGKPTLVLSSFIMWVFMTKPSLKTRTLLALVIWVYIFIFEMLSESHLTASNVALLQASLTGGLLYLAIRKPRTAHARKSRVTIVKPAAMPSSPASVTSSTPKTTPNGIPNGPKSYVNGLSPLPKSQLLSPIPNGHASPAASVRAATLSNGFASRLSSVFSPIAKHPTRSHETAPHAEDDYDYNMPKLSLGTPRKGPPSVASPSSPGVFALRTYKPAAGALFSPRSASPRSVLSPPRLRSELHHSAWIAGGYWQRGQPAGDPGHPLSRSSSQSSGFVDAFGSRGGSVQGDERPPLSPTPWDARSDCGWPASQWEARSTAGSQADWRSCVASQGESWTRPAPASQYDPWARTAPQQESWNRGASQFGAWSRPGASPPNAQSCASFAHDSSSQLSARSFGSSQTADGSLLGVAGVHRGVVVALVLGFSIAFNMFALMLLLFKDRL